MVSIASSSVMVPVPSMVDTPLAKAAFDGLERRSTMVSFCSSSASPVTVTATVLLVWPGVKVSVSAVMAV